MLHRFNVLFAISVYSSHGLMSLIPGWIQDTTILLCWNGICSYRLLTTSSILVTAILIGRNSTTIVSIRTSAKPYSRRIGADVADLRSLTAPSLWSLRLVGAMQDIVQVRVALGTEGGQDVADKVERPEPGVDGGELVFAPAERLPDTGDECSKVTPVGVGHASGLHVGLDPADVFAATRGGGRSAGCRVNESGHRIGSPNYIISRGLQNRRKCPVLHAAIFSS